MVWIGLDDTDSVESGCTTYEFHLLLEELESRGYELEGEPRLVRLWPFAPGRTRGNAALSAKISSPWLEELLDILTEWFESRYQETSIHRESSPTMVICEGQVEEDLYWEAVRGFVDYEDVLQRLEDMNRCMILVAGSGEGVVGAAASIAWRSEGDHTWEATAWRFEENVGSERAVSSKRVEEMEREYPDTFLNRDPRKTRVLIAPRTPCPILYGIRGESEPSTSAAHRFLQDDLSTERCSAARTHKTNQATNDHLDGSKMAVCISMPIEVKGGHRSIKVFDGMMELTLTAFEPSADISAMMRGLVIGDHIEWRGLRAPDGSVHLESMRLRDSIPRELTRPRCECGGRFARQGAGQPLRCQSCGILSESYWVASKSLPSDWVEPPPANRRHLARPLSREPKR